ncbi:MAG: hypothetical protein ACRC0V_08815, partial [Fusobacteriaceae bacterium]
GRVKVLEIELENFLNISKISEDQLVMLQLVQEKLNHGKTLIERYVGDLKEIQIGISEALGKDDVGNILRILNKIEIFEPSELHNYNYPKNDVQIQKQRALVGVKEKVMIWIEKIYCSEIGKMDNFQRINIRYSKQLFKLGFAEASSKLENKIDEFMRNIEMVREINEVENNIKRFINDTMFSTNTSYQDLKLSNKKIKELTDSLEKNSAIPENLRENYKIKLSVKQQEIRKYISNIENKIQDIYDLTEELDTNEKVEKVTVLIPALLGRGLDSEQGQELREIQNFITFVIDKMSELKKVKKIDELEIMKNEIEEYTFHEDLCIDMTTVLNNEYEILKSSIIEKENKWKIENLDVSLEIMNDLELQKHLRKLENYPEFISEKILKEIESLIKKINEILSKNKLEFLILKFNELNLEEKTKFKNIILEK